MYKTQFYLLNSEMGLLEFLQIIHTCRRMSILQISHGIMKIINNIVNQIDFYEDFPFKIHI